MSSRPISNSSSHLFPSSSLNSLPISNNNNADVSHSNDRSIRSVVSRSVSRVSSSSSVQAPSSAAPVAHPGLCSSRPVPASRPVIDSDSDVVSTPPTPPRKVSPPPTSPPPTSPKAPPSSSPHHYDCPICSATFQQLGKLVQHADKHAAGFYGGSIDANSLLIHGYVMCGSCHRFFKRNMY